MAEPAWQTGTALRRLARRRAGLARAGRHGLGAGNTGVSFSYLRTKASRAGLNLETHAVCTAW